MKKNHIIDLKGALRTVLNDLLLHVISYHVNILLQNVKDLITVVQNHVNFLNWCTMGGVWKEHWGWFPINKFICSHFRCSMEPLFQVMLLFRGEATKISFQAFVGDFRLTICLWVIS